MRSTRHLLGRSLFVALALCLPAIRAAAQPNMGPPAVGVVRAERTPIVETSEFIGRVEAVSRVSLVARVTAFLEQRLFTEGSEVKQGDLLYKLEEGPFQADFMAKQAALGQQNALLLNANQTLGRQQALLNTPAGQRSNLDSAIAQQRSQAAQVLAAQANLATSQINLDYTQIKAPIAGKISRTAVTEGNVVGPTTGTLATIVSQDPIYVVFPISSRSAFDLRARYAGHGGFGAVRVRIRLPTGRIYEQDGKLDYIDPTISSTTDSLTARAVLPNPLRGDAQADAAPAAAPAAAPDAHAGATHGAQATRELIDGEFVQVLVQGLTPIEVLGVPRSAVLSDQQGDYVFTVDAQNHAQQTRVQLGQSTPSLAAVISGLTEGQTVITEGIQRVRPGMQVVPGPASPAPAPPAPHAG
jgi:membrane fusion protein (multidrug efflux system)